MGGLVELKAMADTGNIIWDLALAEGAVIQLGWDKIKHKDELLDGAIQPCSIGNAIAYNTKLFPELLQD